MGDPRRCRQCDRTDRHTHLGPGYELRYVEGPEMGGLDEVIARGATVHLERMDRGHWVLIVVTEEGVRLHVSIASVSGRAWVPATVEVDP